MHGKRDPGDIQIGRRIFDEFIEVGRIISADVHILIKCSYYFYNAIAKFFLFAVIHLFQPDKLEDDDGGNHK